MKRTDRVSKALRVGAVALLAFGGVGTMASATDPCDDFGECKALVEINASDGDIGFHFLFDGDELRAARLFDSNGEKLFQDRAFGPLREQTMTETFLESAEPLCWEDPEAEPDEEIVTLEEFLERWSAGTYVVTGIDADEELVEGSTELTFELPAAPADVDFDGSVITWGAGDDLGECADNEELGDLVAEGILPVHPENVEVDQWEVVLEPDVDSGEPGDGNTFVVRVAGDISPKAVTVPADYLASLPDDTPVKVEVGALGGEDNATFTEEDGFCVNEVEGCEEE